MPDFVKPTPRNPINKIETASVDNKVSHLPPVIDLEQADPVLQEKYSGILKKPNEELLPIPTEEPAQKTFEVPKEAAKEDVPFWINEKPTDQELKEFARCMFGNRDYEKQYTLFGKIKVLFRDISNSSVDEVNRMLEIRKTKGSTPPYLENRLDVAYGLACSLVHTNTNGQTNEFVVEAETDDVFWERLQLLKQLPRPLFMALMESYLRFSHHVGNLTKEAMSPSFLRAAGSI